MILASKIVEVHARRVYSVDTLLSHFTLVERHVAVFHTPGLGDRPGKHLLVFEPSAIAVWVSPLPCHCLLSTNTITTIICKEVSFGKTNFSDRLVYRRQ